MIVKADAHNFLRSLKPGSVDLVFGSPPYENARLYLEDGVDIGIARDTDNWVAWMTEIYIMSLRVCKGLVAFVVEGRTKKFSYTAAPMLLAASLIKCGVTLRKPPIFHRVGIPGSGGPDWLRNDYEFIICATNGGRLPWSDSTACGHECKYPVGGEMSYRNAEGKRQNSWHHAAKKRVPSGYMNGDTKDSECYKPPKLANPGNVIIETGFCQFCGASDEYRAGQGRCQHCINLDRIVESSELINCKVGGGVMGSKLCHENEAPFPEKLAAFFIKSFCPPGGLVCDPFAGSGTTLTVAERLGRMGIGCDIRQSQVDLTTRRMAEQYI